MKELPLAYRERMMDLLGEDFAAYEAALVLGGLLVGFLHLRILFHRIRGADGGLQFLAQGIPGDGLVRPQLCLTAVAVGDR